VTRVSGSRFCIASTEVVVYESDPGRLHAASVNGPGGLMHAYVPDSDKQATLCGVPVAASLTLWPHLFPSERHHSHCASCVRVAVAVALSELRDDH